MPLRWVGGASPHSKNARSTLQNLFKDIDEAGLEPLLTALRAKRVLSESDGKISYSRPPG